jgi:hypothetical protein
MSRRHFAGSYLPSFALALIAAQVFAADPRVPAAAAPARLLELARKARSRGPGGLTADELVELHAADAALDPHGVGFWEELAWWWAAQGGLDQTAAASKLAAAYERQRGAVPAGFRERLDAALDGLPTAGRASYVPPAYLISGMAYRVQPILVPRKAPFGIIEKDGISQRSILQAVP